MTERFSIGDRVLQDVYCGCIPAILDGGIPCTQGHVLKLLNELDDENEYLKQQNEKYSNYIELNIKVELQTIEDMGDDDFYHFGRLDILKELEKEFKKGVERMTENKRFVITKSNIIEDGWFIDDTVGNFSFGTTKDKSSLVMYEKQLNELHDKNKQLQERNNRQVEQLDNIYHLIEKEDWKTLKGIIEEFQECEEQLQYEWRRESGWSLDSYSE